MGDILCRMCYQQKQNTHMFQIALNRMLQTFDQCLYKKNKKRNFNDCVKARVTHLILSDTLACRDPAGIFY